MSDITDYQKPERPASKPENGAQFARLVGADADRWAREFLAAYGSADHVKTDAERQAFVAKWFREAMNAALDAHKEADVQ